MERSDQKQVKLKSRTKSVIIAHTHRSCNKMQQLIYLANWWTLFTVGTRLDF